MPESIEDLIALVLGLVVICLCEAGSRPRRGRAAASRLSARPRHEHAPKATRDESHPVVPQGRALPPLLPVVGVEGDRGPGDQRRRLDHRLGSLPGKSHENITQLSRLAPRS